MAGKMELKFNLKKGSDSQATSKVKKISEAQQYMLVAVFGASIFLGIAVALVIKFVDQIAFNANVIAEEERVVVSLSNTIKNIGICTKPKGEIYTDEELKKCSPNEIAASAVPGTLRSNILQTMAANAALTAVPKQDISYCVNNATDKNFTYAELHEFYNEALEEDNVEKIAAATELIQICSALRVIPDALPSYRNEEALLSSFNRIFIMSDWEPEGLSPAGTYEVASFGSGLYTIPFQLSVDADTATTMLVLSNVERSIREFDVRRATIEWSSNNSLSLNSELAAYYTAPSVIKEETKTIKYGDSEFTTSSSGGQK